MTAGEAPVTKAHADDESTVVANAALKTDRLRIKYDTLGRPPYVLSRLIWKLVSSDLPFVGCSVPWTTPARQEQKAGPTRYIPAPWK